MAGALACIALQHATSRLRKWHVEPVAQARTEVGALEGQAIDAHGAQQLLGVAEVESQVVVTVVLAGEHLDATCSPPAQPGSGYSET
jgi:hypothetical protein